jgi:phthiocerol/phenolphthiocerol synthesis type-I polyketide synthase E
MNSLAANGLLVESPDVERLLLQIWRECFKSVSVEPADNFFDLGGDSLSAIMLVGMCNERFGTMLPAGVLFEKPTVSALATAIIETGKQQ